MKLFSTIRAIKTYTRFVGRCCHAYFKVHLQQDRELCLVYQMGKVASSSIANTLEGEKHYRQFQVHRLNPNNIALVSQQRKKHRQPSTASDIVGSIVYRKFIQTGTPCKIVTLVREPVGRNISAFFQNAQSVRRPVKAGHGVNIDMLVREFLDSYPHDVPLRWFDEEMLVTTGIDVYDYEFPKSTGYQVIDNTPYQLLIMRHDLENNQKVEILNSFLGTKIERMKNRNIGEEKAYKETYNKFKESIRLPNDYVEHLLSSKYCKHFYSEEDIRKLYAKYL